MEEQQKISSPGVVYAMQLELYAEMLDKHCKVIQEAADVFFSSEKSKNKGMNRELILLELKDAQRVITGISNLFIESTLVMLKLLENAANELFVLREWEVSERWARIFVDASLNLSQMLRDEAKEILAGQGS